MTTISLTRLEADVASNLSISPERAVRLCDELSDMGYTTWEEVEDAMFYVTDDCQPIRNFVQFILDDIEEGDVPSWVVVDYNLTWECNLRHDYTMITDGETNYFMFQ